MALWIGYWWCDHCAVAVDREHATIAATHALEGGGCGKRLTERFNSTEPPEDAELTRLTAERDALAAEVARLREVRSAALDLCDAWDANGFSRKCLVTGTPGWALYKLIRSCGSQ